MVCPFSESSSSCVYFLYGSQSLTEDEQVGIVEPKYRPGLPEPPTLPLPTEAMKDAATKL